MGIHVAINHTTVYNFDRPVLIHPHQVRLRPAPHTRTPIHAYDLNVEPADHFLNWQQDPFGNYIARLNFPEKTSRLAVAVNLIAELATINPFDFFVEEAAEQFSFSYEPTLAADLSPYLDVEPPSDRLRQWLRKAQPETNTRTVDYLVELNQMLANDIAYSVRMEPGVQTPDETLQRAIGSCRDSAWLLVAICRHLGLAARFVSGYLIQLRDDQPSLDGPDGPTADFTDLHAWAEVFLPGAGWVGLDPTSGLFASEGHIPLAATPTPTSAAAIAGTTEPCKVEFSFENTVERIREDRRTTLPYTDKEWEAIDDLGRRVDAQLDTADVRLTMGGEPTFVSIDDFDADEWTTDADGEHKRQLATDLTARLATRFATDGFVQYGQGKWYPGEPLPRWRQTLFWRTDGQPLWHNPELLADPTTDGNATLEDAKNLLTAIADLFGIGHNHILAAYEDPVPNQWEASKAPGGEPAQEVDAVAFDILPDDKTNPELTGYALPLHTDGDRWATAHWTVRRNHLYLLSGDGPIGFRLPLDSLTWAETPSSYERSAFDQPDDLAPAGTMPTQPAVVTPVDAAAPTAISAELVNSHVAVFLPPLESADHGIELLSVLEAAATATEVPIKIIGYPLVGHPHLRSLSVTPDPGVIEVNIHPASSWEELKATTVGLYHDAKQTRLGTEKFDLDGKHTGTGGGNHVTVGGATPSNSPLLRRPDLLRSFITYWQHHPALSYLFSGQFIGPTSQAPRIDEARHDSLYEAEIAFDQLAAQSQTDAAAKPWLADRLFRHLLVDVEGNTHRAEFCIDKLYNPESDRGRLGLLELRAFEMPPHPQLALTQTLLVRALIARFWNEPYVGRLVRWGTELHDRFMLSSYVRQDCDDVIGDLHDHRIPFDAAWLEPFVEFRFPVIGETEIAGTRYQLRTAIEPWNVLSEQQNTSGTSRYVDSSVERVELVATGFNPKTHLVCVNGQIIPLRTVAPNTDAAGVRFKAWSPPSSLHPTIDPQGPLRFDVVDKSHGRSVGGFIYHVTHPGGRSYDTFPVNAQEAEARRNLRFVKFGRTMAPFDIRELTTQLAKRGTEFTATVDLRQYH